MITNKNYKIQILKENYNQQENKDEISFSEYVNLESQSDPNFFSWLFGSDCVDDQGHLTTEGEEAFEEFLAELK